MYTGLAMMDLAFWIPQLASTDTLFFVLQATFCICLLMAAWFQEKETVARFGKDAEDYYQKTPRFVLLYPFAH
jgi:protein-S-isoprenylcysteine O-methyltransferase Ste14